IPAPGRPPVTLIGPRHGGPIGHGVCAPGDVNRDGHADVLVDGYDRRNGPQSALLFSTTGPRIATYTGLRGTGHTRSGAVGAGDFSVPAPSQGLTAGSVAGQQRRERARLGNE